jgi:cell division protease FtsH
MFNKNKNKETAKNNSNKNIKTEKTRKPSFFGNFLTTLLIFFLLISLYSFIQGRGDSEEQVALSNLSQDIINGSIKKISVSGDELTVEYTDGAKKISKKEFGTSLSETLSFYGVAPESLRKIDIEILNQSGIAFWLLNLAPILLPVIFLALIIWFLSRQVKGAGMQAFSFGQSRARLIDPEDKNKRVTFKDIAGVKEAKEELQEIVDFLKHPKKFLDIGARIPKGVLLMGPAGTGKTLLARGVAGEAGVPFFSVSGSEFVELFVGIGASRVRDTFRMAKKAAPAIIFIDEIDAVGRVRGAGIGGGNDEREQTLNQILVEMDGFEPTEKVIVMAATNMPAVLDPALLRPGRFDRRVTLSLPDRDDREAILKIHARGIPLGEDVNFRVISERTPGFSGADLYSLMNESAILAARESRKKVSQYDMIRSIEKVMLGPERKSHLLSKREKEIVAYHEAGHALVASILPNADPVHKVSIIARGHNTGGFTMKLPVEERRLPSRSQFNDDLSVALGGFVAEQLVFGDITIGPSSDLQVATATARDMVTKYGMSENIGPIALDEMAGTHIPGRPVEREYSEQVAAKVDAEVSRIIDEAKSRAESAVKEHRKALDGIAEYLIEHESAEKDEFEKLLLAHGIIPKKKEDIGGGDMRPHAVANKDG